MKFAIGLTTGWFGHKTDFQRLSPGINGSNFAITGIGCYVNCQGTALPIIGNNYVLQIIKIIHLGLKGHGVLS